MWLAILAVAAALLILLLGVDLAWGSGPVLSQAPWYIPLVSAFNALTTLCIAYLALGRYHVLRDSLSFWVGSGFAAYGIGQIFYALTWPGLLPGGRSIVGQLANTPAWIAILGLTVLIAFLLAATQVRVPGSQIFAGTRWVWVVLAWLLVVTVGLILLISLESSLPLFVDANGRYTFAQRVWVMILMVLFAMGSVLSSLHYKNTRDRLAGYIVFPQMALVFICAMVLLGGKRYDLWWYLQRVVLASGYLTVLFGLLSEYIRLLRRENEGMRLLQAILDNIPVGLAVTGGAPDFQISHVSRYGRDMNQRSLQHLTGLASGQHQMNWQIYLPDGITMPAMEDMPLYRAGHSGEEVRNVELLMRAENGTEIPVLANASPIRDAEGNIVAAINTWLDITDRKRAEEILRESEALYRAIAGNIPNGGVFLVDKNLRYVIAEGSVVEGNTIREIFNPETAAKMEARFWRAFAGETISYETEYNGRIYWTQHVLLTEPADHTIVVTLDITERKEAEKALAESEQRFRAIVNQATAGIVRSDANGRLVFVNQAFCEMLGVPEPELMSKTIWMFTHQEDVEDDQRFYNRLMEKGIPFHVETRFIRRDGSVVWVTVSTAPILDELGKPHSAVSVVVDISERRQAEEELMELNSELENRVRERTFELQTANAALNESRERLQILSQRLVEVQEQERHALARELHDRVGQSLTALNLNLTIISDQLSKQSLSPLNNRLMDSIKLVTETIGIVRDVMSDLRPVVLDEYGLGAALHSYIGRFEARYNIHVEFIQSQQPIPRLGAAMEMTVLRIAQEALLNIARHAQATEVTITLDCEQNVIFLVVQDNGIGIQMDDHRQRNGHGLMIMRERAEAIGGRLRVISAAGKGTRIEASLPFHNNGSSNT
jgi:PAS domain S-box-containing protein